jgi:soluble lytic murein transglycosylase
MVLLLILSNNSWFMRLIYPLYYREIILDYSREYSVDPHLIAAIIYVESKYILNAESDKGALGLMQIMPKTGEWIAKQLIINDYSNSDLFNPETNIRFGSWYLSYLSKEFNADKHIMISAYNAGIGKVKEWLDKEVWNGNIGDVKNIPYGETRKYLKDVLKVYKIYLRIYNF